MKKPALLALVFLAAAIVAVVLHNVISGILRTEEPVFFILELASAAGFVGSLLYLLVRFLAEIISCRWK